MLPSKNRLNLKRSYTWVRSGRNWEGNSIRVFYRFGQNRSPKVGIATSGAVFKKAHDRNRARRLTSTAFQKIYSDLPSSINIVATPKASVLELTSDEIFNQLSKLKDEINRHISA
jgi:ribonuclease P protein component